MPYNKISDFREEILTQSSLGHSSIEIATYLKDNFGEFGIKDSSLERQIRSIVQFLGDKEIISENVRLAKEKQKYQDLNRIERKAFREQARVENAVTAIGSALLEVNNKYAELLVSKINIAPLKKTTATSGIGVIHVTDTHFNEKIDLPHNKYNFHIASSRLKFLTQESIDFFDYKGIKRVVIAYTGDLLNSDRRLDEILNQETNRAKAATLSAHLIRQQILHIRNAGFEVDIVSVLGNESRVKQEMSFSNESFSDNYDFTIMAQVRDVLTFSKIDGINFISIDKMESVVNIGTHTILFTHGINLINSKQKDIQSVIGKYAQQGVNIDYIMYGHGHAFRGTDLSCQASSLCGANSYSDHSLGLAGRASGVCHVFKGKEHSMQYIDLQEVDNEGYEIVSQLETYNVKSEQKLHSQTPIFQVVI